MHIHTQEYYSAIKMNENLLFAFSSRSSQPRNRTRVSCIAGGFFTCWVTRESECEVAQSCLTLWDPMDCSLPGSSVHGIFQAIVLEWIAITREAYEKRMKICHLWQHGWAWRVLCSVREDREIQKLCVISYLKNKTNKHNKIETNTWYRGQTNGYQWGDGRRVGSR